MLSVILPTFNESKNLPELVERLEKMLTVPHEIIVVDDDSPDRTWEVAEKLRKDGHAIRILRRKDRRGLSSAVVEGFALAEGSVFLVMDSDLQHDTALVMKLTKAIESGADVAVASRYMEGGSIGEWVTGRRLLSKAGTWLGRSLPPVHSTDPMSGFFAIRRSAYAPIVTKLHPTGFKILLEILSCLPSNTRITEVPLRFQLRKHGESKLNLKVEGEFILQIFRIALKRLWQLITALQLWIFFIVALVVLLVLLPKAWAVQSLYLDSHIRSNVQSALERTADFQGWLLSDIEVTDVSVDAVRILHHEHLRGPDSIECFDLSLHSPEMTPCTINQ